MRRRSAQTERTLSADEIERSKNEVPRYAQSGHNGAAGELFVKGGDGGRAPGRTLSSVSEDRDKCN
jgi:hypothetical protein